MINISNKSYDYIDTYYNEQKKALIYNAFRLFEAFDVSDYESPYLDMITSVEDIGYTRLQDLFNARLIRDLVFIIESHGIIISRDHEVELKDMVDIVSFLFLIQNRETYDEVATILNSPLENDDKLSAMFGMYRLMDDKRLRELITEIDDNFLDSLSKHAHRALQEEIEDPKDKLDYITYVHQFFAFIGEEACAGKSLYHQGYKKLSIEELLDILPYDLRDHLNKDSSEHMALDILSILVITCDDDIDLVEKHDRVIDMLYKDRSRVTVIKPIIGHMLTDFNSYREAMKQLESDHGNNL